MFFPSEVLRILQENYIIIFIRSIYSLGPFTALIYYNSVNSMEYLPFNFW